MMIYGGHGRGVYPPQLVSTIILHLYDFGIDGSCIMSPGPAVAKAMAGRQGGHES
ncbi:MAG: hypothetical protein UU47_C0002G0017 [candidate division TM6 bacterium GW2011_GWE2_41_16]|nr:MAG: hypothetical protein UU47_C0002G0017 [candidate division TM6 bacterium GW2011_GWE2_41_16]